MTGQRTSCWYSERDRGSPEELPRRWRAARMCSSSRRGCQAVRQVAVESLPPAGYNARCARACRCWRRCTGQFSPTPSRITSGGVRALASAPHLEPPGVYFILALSTGKESEIESEGARLTHPRARAVALHTCSIGPARLRPSSHLTPAALALRPSLAHHAPPALAPYARPALLAHPLGSGARERLHWQLPSR